MILLMTGATGAFGRRMLRTVADCDEVERIYVLGREDRRQMVSRKIEFIAGDITKEIEIADRTRGEITAILHAAAETRFSAPLETARRVNVVGSANLIGLASSCPKLNRFIFLSTVYVTGKRRARVFENEIIEPDGFVNAYEQSKFEAEQFLRARMADLPIVICRLSTILGHARTGEIDKIGAIHQAIQLYYYSLLPMIPGTAESPVDLISSEYAVAAVDFFLRHGFESGKTFHISAADDAIPLMEFLQIVRQCFLQNRPEWRRRAIELPAVTELKTFDLFVRTVEQTGSPALRQSVMATKYFAPQLAYPKLFDDRECAFALAGGAIKKPVLRDFLGRIVGHLIQEKRHFARDNS